MSQFVIETVPLPPSNPLEEPSRWVPFKPNATKCGNGKCLPVVGRCLKCGDVFPCPSGNCGHMDCADPGLFGIACEGNGTDIPDFVKESYVIQPQDALVSSDTGKTPVSEERPEQD